MDIPITVTFKGSRGDLERELFGLGDEITNPEILRLIPAKDKPLRKVNQNAIIIDGVVLSSKKTSGKITESIDILSFVDYQFVLSIEEVIGLTKLFYEITDWFLKRTKALNCKIKIDGKEIKTPEEFQKTLDEYFESKSNNQ